MLPSAHHPPDLARIFEQHRLQKLAVSRALPLRDLKLLLERGDPVVCAHVGRDGAGGQHHDEKHHGEPDHGRALFQVSMTLPPITHVCTPRHACESPWLIAFALSSWISAGFAA